jgi:glutamine amidotransferase
MITIVDYGMGNLRSAQKGFERVGHPAVITSDPTEVARASKIVLPGVGAFGDAMTNLRASRLISPLLDAVQRRIPLLGICLGLQLFFEESEEHGLHKGLGLLPGCVRRFPKGQRIPQIGWNQLHFKCSHPLLDGVPDGAFVYFVNSYYSDPSDPSDIVATTDYGIDFTSIAVRDHLFGVQFHPEKSQEVGLRILKNFGEI